MPDYRGITYPIPEGTPPRASDMEYCAATSMLPLEKNLVESLYNNTELELSHSIKEVSVFGREHTVVGHYTEFLPEPRIVPSQTEDEAKDGCCFYIDGCSAPFGSIYYIYHNNLACIEIYSLGEDFPPDGITRKIKAITFGDPNLSGWKESLVS